MMTEQQMLDKARELVKSFHTAMLVTRTENETLVSRPMGVAQVDDDCTLTFVSKLDSAKVSEAVADASVAVTMQSALSYVSISGRARIVDDAREKDEVWSTMDNVWFDGPRDESAVLIKVYPYSVEYWDSRGVQGLKFIVEAVRARVTGTEPRTSQEEHGAVAPNQVVAKGPAPSTHVGDR